MCAIHLETSGVMWTLSQLMSISHSWHSRILQEHFCIKWNRITVVAVKDAHVSVSKWRWCYCAGISLGLVTRWLRRLWTTDSLMDHSSVELSCCLLLGLDQRRLNSRLDFSALCRSATVIPLNGVSVVHRLSPSFLWRSLSAVVVVCE